MPDALATHWLLMQEPLGRDEIEALIVSRAVGAAWIDDRTIGWQPGVILQGPLTAEELASGGALPEWVGAVYSVTSPRERAAAIPPELQLPGGVLTPFVDGEPAGVERETLETLEAIARRMGGGVLTDTGDIVVPEARADLALFTDTWIESEDMVRYLSGVAAFEDGDGPVLPPGMDIAGYALVSHFPDGSVVAVTASEVDAIPLAFSGYEWASGGVYVYEFRHYPPQRFDFSSRLPATPAEAEAMVDTDAAALIERLAGTVLRVVSPRGHLCDDDGFLVSFA